MGSFLLVTGVLLFEKSWTQLLKGFLRLFIFNCVFGHKCNVWSLYELGQCNIALNGASVPPHCGSESSLPTQVCVLPSPLRLLSCIFLPEKQDSIRLHGPSPVEQQMLDKSHNISQGSPLHFSTALSQKKPPKMSFSKPKIQSHAQRLNDAKDMC